MRVLKNIRAVALLCLLSLAGAAQEFTVNFTFDSQGRPMIQHPSDPAYYYILYRGEEIADIVSAVDMALGVQIGGGGGLLDISSLSPTAFYQVLPVPISQPLDTDGDGIFDDWELRFRRPGSALNKHDSREDHDGDGTPDLDQFQIPVASFATKSSTVFAINSKVVSVTMQFSNTFQGEAIVLLGGTAVPGQDFEIGGYNPQNQTARVVSAGDTATFVITLKDKPTIDPDRDILLSILEPTAKIALAQRYRTSLHKPVGHTVHIVESDVGTYAGILDFSGEIGSGKHPIRLALRSASDGSVVGYLDATQSSLFRQTFTLPVKVGGDGVLSGFPQPLTHETEAKSLGRVLTYKLQIGILTAPPQVIQSAENGPPEQVLEAPVTLRLSGLSSSGKTVTSEGLLRLVRVANTERFTR